ncbi:MAG: response regulator [Candidatus Aminicenantes bacterium]|nr:response regulator [Candidatus Aminicenantes bacterium]
MNNNNENEKRKIKVAWYENNVPFVEPILYYLKKEKVFDVKIFGNPDSAEKEITDYHPDLVIFDYRMPNITGLQMFNRLKGKFSFAPVFFSIWANDEVTKAELLDAKVESRAIFDKRIEPASFAKALYEYYMSKTDKNK